MFFYDLEAMYDEFGLLGRQGVKFARKVGDGVQLSADEFLFGVADVVSERFIFLVCVWMLVVVLKDPGEFDTFFGH